MEALHTTLPVLSMQSAAKIACSPAVGTRFSLKGFTESSSTGKGVLLACSRCCRSRKQSEARGGWEGVGSPCAEQLGCAVPCTDGVVEHVLPSNLRLDGPLGSLLQGLRCRREAMYLLKRGNTSRKSTGFSLWFA